MLTIIDKIHTDKIHDGNLTLENSMYENHPQDVLGAYHHSRNWLTFRFFILDLDVDFELLRNIIISTPISTPISIS